MARRVFFSFHYQNDIWRVKQITNSGEFTDVNGTDTFYDNSLWEKTKRSGDQALKNLINEGLQNSSVTTVLTGSQTWARKWVRYELIKSFERGNGLITLYIDQVKDANGQTSQRGADPLDRLFFRKNADGKTAQTWYHSGTSWMSHETIATATLPKPARGAAVKEGRLSAFASRHIWTAGNAKEFAKWTDDAATTAGR